MDAPTKDRLSCYKVLLATHDKIAKLLNLNSIATTQSTGDEYAEHTPEELLRNLQAIFKSTPLATNPSQVDLDDGLSSASNDEELSGPLAHPATGEETDEPTAEQPVSSGSSKPCT